MAVMQPDDAKQVTAPRDVVSADLRWTGHPLVDHGIAALIAFTDSERGGVSRPEDVMTDDLEAFALFAERALQTESVRSHASVLFTINVPYLQPSHPAEKKAANARWLFRMHDSETAPADEPCLYCGRPSILVSAVAKGDRLYRELVPLLTGQGVLNFAPAGDHGLSVCSRCIVTLQALVFGAPSCEGRALVVQADDPRFLTMLVRGWLPDIRKRIELSAATGKKVDTWKAPRTRLVERLVSLEQESEGSESATGVTVFHLSNSGQGPSIGIYSLSARVVHFVRVAQGALYLQSWRRLEGRAWRDEKYREADRGPDDTQRPYWRNTFYEQLFNLPNGAGRFVRGRLLAAQVASVSVKTPDSHVPMWALTALFLSEVTGVEKPRIDAIRDLADAVADEIVSNNDRRLFRSAYQATRYPSVRRLLLQANSRRMLRGAAPLVTLESFLMIFEDAEELARPDWRLAWDLVLIRMVDRLHELGWVREHKDAIEDAAAALDSSDNDAEVLASDE